MSWLVAGAEALTGPSVHLDSPVERGTARLLAACSIAIAAIILAQDAVSQAEDSASVVRAVTYGSLLTTYALSRTRYYRVGSVVATLMFPCIALAQTLCRGHIEVSSLFHAMLAPFVAGMFLGVSVAAWCAVCTSALVIVLLGISSDALSLSQSVSLSISSLLTSVVAVSYAVHRDWLEEKRRVGSQLQEAQLVQMQKMEAVGRLAGGIAHDFNNLLTVIAGGVELLGRKSAQKELRLIESATNSARALTSQLLTLSRQGVVQDASCDLAGNLAQMDRLLGRIIGEDITLKIHLAPGLHHVKLSDTQLQQIVLNLATNARDAMPKGGVLELAARNDGDDRVLLTVSDTGIGMDEVTQGRAFEPFFTTKPVGKGTGLGLSMVFGLITQSGGVITIDSRPGLGTTFELTLPRAEQLVAGSESVDQGLELWGHAEGTILLVEDDVRVRSVCRTVLRREGYKVIDAGDPLEAIELFRAKGHEVDLVISDIVMPKMTGVELGEVLRRQRPDLSILYVSGYAPEDVLGRGFDTRALLKKPFRPVELLRRVSSVLHGLDSQMPPAVSSPLGALSLPVYDHIADQDEESLERRILDIEQ